MVIAVGSKVEAADVNAIILKINNESVTRELGLAVIIDVVVGNKCQASEHDSWRVRDDLINANHCWCEVDPAHDPGDPPGGTPLVLTAPNVAVGDYLEAVTQMQTLEADVDNLIAQCNCDTYEQQLVCACNVFCDCNAFCACDAECTCVAYSSCGNDCTCNAETGCGCNTDCLCQAQCSCNTFRTPSCLDWTFVCVCEVDCDCDYNDERNEDLLTDDYDKSCWNCKKTLEAPSHD